MSIDAKDPRTATDAARTAARIQAVARAMCAAEAHGPDGRSGLYDDAQMLWDQPLWRKWERNAKVFVASYDALEPPAFGLTWDGK